MPISLVRVDDRLIHGQVVMTWTRHIHCTAIKIVDDQVAADDFMTSLLRSISPGGISLDIVDIATGAEQYPQWESSNDNIMILVKTPLTLMALEELGVEFQSINIGGIAISKDRKKFHRNIALTEEEREYLLEKVKQGVEIYYQMIVSERRLTLTEKMFK